MAVRRDETSFSWAVDPTEPISTIRFAGDVDLRAEESTAALLRSVPPSATGVLLDLAGVSFIDSSGLRSLVTIKQEVEERGSRLFLTRPAPPVTQLLEIAGMSTFFEFADGRRKSWWYAFKEARGWKKHGLVRP